MDQGDARAVCLGFFGASSRTRDGLNHIDRGSRSQARGGKIKTKKAKKGAEKAKSAAGEQALKKVFANAKIFVDKAPGGAFSRDMKRELPEKPSGTYKSPEPEKPQPTRKQPTGLALVFCMRKT